MAPTFFIDSCLGKGIAKRLQALGLNAVHHDELFDEGTEDIVWIPHVAALGYVILTKDKAIRKDSAEREAVIASKAIMLTYANGRYTVEDMITIFETEKVGYRPTSEEYTCTAHRVDVQGRDRATVSRGE